MMGQEYRIPILNNKKSHRRAINPPGQLGTLKVRQPVKFDKVNNFG